MQKLYFCRSFDWSFNKHLPNILKGFLECSLKRIINALNYWPYQSRKQWMKKKEKTILSHIDRIHCTFVISFLVIYASLFYEPYDGFKNFSVYFLLHMKTFLSEIIACVTSTFEYDNVFCYMKKRILQPSNLNTYKKNCEKVFFLCKLDLTLCRVISTWDKTATNAAVQFCTLNSL